MPFKKKKKWPFHTKYTAKIGISEFSARNNFCPIQKLTTCFQSEEKQELKKRRKTEFYVVKITNTERLKQSSVPYMQGLLNKYEEENRHKKT